MDVICHMSELKTVDFVYFHFHFHVFYFSDLGLGFSMMSHMTVTNCHTT